MFLKLGNVAPVEVVDGERTPLAVDRSWTDVHVPDDAPLAEAFVTVTSPQGVWAYHSDAAPAWVASDNEALAQLIASQYGCPIGEPEEGAEAWVAAAPAPAEEPTSEVTEEVAP